MLLFQDEEKVFSVLLGSKSKHYRYYPFLIVIKAFLLSGNWAEKSFNESLRKSTAWERIMDCELREHLGMCVRLLQRAPSMNNKRLLIRFASLTIKVYVWFIFIDFRFLCSENCSLEESYEEFYGLFHPSCCCSFRSPTDNLFVGGFSRFILIGAKLFS